MRPAGLLLSPGIHFFGDNMFYFNGTKETAETAWHEKAPACEAEGYCFLLSSAESEAEASAIAAEITRMLDPKESREANIVRVERFLGKLDFLDRQFDIRWNENGFVDEFCDTNEEWLLAGIAASAGVPERYAEFFVSHAASKLAGYLGNDEYLTDFIDPDSQSDFAREVRYYLNCLACAA